MTEAAGVTVEGVPGARPRVVLPEGDPPAGLVILDLHEGEGAPVPPGARVRPHHVGWGGPGGAQFDASWDRGTPLDLPLSRVIDGWREGIAGMRPGGRRLLVIPPGQRRRAAARLGDGRSSS